MSFFLVLVALVLFVIFLTIYYYNKFVALRNQADESWSGIDVQLKRRIDLIPNLVETVKGYAAHEMGTLEKVISARGNCVSAKGVNERVAAENMLTSALKSLFAVVESYPDLKANQHFSDLQRSLTDIEDTIQLARRYYNAVVRDYNTLCETFPPVIIASLFRFTKRAFFEIGEADRENVAVKF